MISRRKAIAIMAGAVTLISGRNIRIFAVPKPAADASAGSWVKMPASFRAACALHRGHFDPEIAFCYRRNQFVFRSGHAVFIAFHAFSVDHENRAAASGRGLLTIKTERD